MPGSESEWCRLEEEKDISSLERLGGEPDMELRSLTPEEVEPPLTLRGVGSENGCWGAGAGFSAASGSTGSLAGLKARHSREAGFLRLR